MGLMAVRGVTRGVAPRKRRRKEASKRPSRLAAGATSGASHAHAGVWWVVVAVISKRPTPTSHHSSKARQEWVVCTCATHSHHSTPAPQAIFLAPRGNFTVSRRPWRGFVSKYCTWPAKGRRGGAPK